MIKGSTVNAGGKTGGYTVPNPQAQAALIAEAVRRSASTRAPSAAWRHTAPAPPSATRSRSATHQAFEELGASPDEFRCAVSSVKAAIGHLEGAAGIAGLHPGAAQLRCGRPQAVPPSFSSVIRTLTPSGGATRLG